MHCVNPNCFDDSCQGECQQENKASQECSGNDPDKDRELVYCED